MITLFMFLNRRFLISDKTSRDASFMDLSDLSLKLLSPAKLSDLDFFLQLFSEVLRNFRYTTFKKANSVSPKICF